ncbi:MAG: bifunctional tRNA (5-methylaminomethyl-2-thiouridine)(34)-methyltransferase MnmD/FAD-dependent 5-carboxymethylaminomethyl-2-thiouridine(34) oxidoreductase MnmC, partial [Pseudomonadales bacterium]|nr:bifunctional tRNA (5-methylaminomethyl-2-thiouridine)(34)-methyltransferase MnmD/FAD-dependent 5-carboxymethylaminomethyl-2-thiouridine(34) oxidoreductase MnmC [Pseudomonadales bacterium]
MPDLKNATITWLESGQPVSSQFDDIYFSSQGGLAESEHVFLAGNGLPGRWQAWPDYRTPFNLVELGFGTGLNFLLTWRLFERLAASNLRLHYLAFEKHPLTHADLERALAQWPELETWRRQLLDVYIDHSGGLHRYCLTGNLTLDLYFGDAGTGMVELLANRPATVDCWFMDGFAPAKNPGLWTAGLAQQMWQSSRPLATVSTYSVAGLVRRNLADAGFTLEKRPGFGNKREMLVASRPASATVADLSGASNPAWFRYRPATYQRQAATIIGAGLAGCSTAYSLARKGWQVTLIDAADTIASAASGNPQAVLQPRLAASLDPQSRFYLQAVLFANRQFSGLQQDSDIGWHASGVLRQPTAGRSGLLKLSEQPDAYYSERFLSPLSRSQASARAGLPLSAAALWLPGGGWLQPAALCAAYLAAIPPTQLTLLTGQPVTGLQWQESGWQVCGGAGLLVETPVVVIANSYQAASLPHCGFLPLLPVAGQLSQAGSTADSEILRMPVVADRYLCPALQHRHSIGASYSPHQTFIEDSQAADRDNLSGALAAFAGLTVPLLPESRASVRCNSGDYFPVVGPLPDYADFVRVYAPLARDASTVCEDTARHWPGLFINVAHGSYGMASCPVSGEL